MCETDEEVRTYKLSELEGSARERAYDRLREWNSEYSWWHETRQDWADNILPETWCIHGVIEDQMYFSCDRDQHMALTNGYLDINELVTKQPELLGNLIIRTMHEKDMLPNRVAIRLDGRHDDTVGVDDIDINVDLTGTAFDGMDDVDFVELIEVPLNEFIDALGEWVCRASRECLEALDNEYEWLTSDECIEDMAEANDYKFDEDGEFIP